MLESLRSLRARAREVFQKKRIQRELDEELSFHLDHEIEKNIAQGMSIEEARRVALVAFGGMSRFREEARGARGFASLEGLLNDTRFALRRLRRAPAFTFGVVSTLAIALGAVAGIGALVYGVMLRPLPFPDSDRLVSVAVHTPGLDITTTEHSAGTLLYLKEESRSFTSLAGYSINTGVMITEGDSPEYVAGSSVTSGLFELLGARPVVGRFFTPQDALADTSGVIISYALWQRRFGGDRDVTSKTIELSRTRRPILGVLSPINEAPWDRIAIYFPEAFTTNSAGLNSRYLTVIGKLTPDATLQSAANELDVLTLRIRDRFPQLSEDQVRQAGLSMTVQSLHDAIVEPVRGELRLLSLMVGVLLLIAVANVATLSLLRAERLRGEIAVANAIGASRSRIFRRFVVENTVLTLGSAAVALPLAWLALTTKFGFTSNVVPRLDSVTMRPALAAGVIVMSLAIGTVLGIIATVRACGSSALALSLREDARSTGGKGWRRVQSTLVTVQVAFALSLLLGAGLMGMSLMRLQSVDLGIDPAEKSVFSLRLPYNGYNTWQRMTGFHNEVEDALRSVPGISGATTAMQLPSTEHLLYVRPRLDVNRRDGSTKQAFVTLNIVSPTFFEVMGLPLRAGRTFEPLDIAGAEVGVVLSTSLAQELFGDENPVGSIVRIAAGGRFRFPPFRVVGVSGDVYTDRVTDGVLRVLYMPMLSQLPQGVDMPVLPAGVRFIVKSSLPLDRLAPLFRSTVAGIDRQIPLTGIRSLDDIVAQSQARTRLTMLLLAVAAAATLLLSAIGLYSVIAFAVQSRTRDFAVRLALGASTGRVTRLVLSEGLVLAVVGVLLGITISLASTQLLRSVLFEVSATDARLYIAGTLLALAITGVAILIPARRAGKEDPARALRA